VLAFFVEPQALASDTAAMSTQITRLSGARMPVQYWSLAR
jgi:hypothetical protein